jgi:hypothetical protein
MEPENKRIYVEGFRTFAKNVKAPDFVLGGMVITLDEFYSFIDKHTDLLTDYQGKKQLKLQILRGKDGRVNFTVDTWKAKETNPVNESILARAPGPVRSQAQLDNTESLPF